MSSQGDYKNPEYVLLDKTTIQLNRITQGALMFFSSEYASRSPKPLPPLYTMSNGETDHLDTDPRYLAELEAWEQQYTYALLKFCIRRGVQNSPPANYILSGATDDPKCDWIINLVEDIQDFQNALLGLSIPTAEGIAEAEKK